MLEYSRNSNDNKQNDQHLVPLHLVYRHTNLFHYFPALIQSAEVLAVLEGIKPATQQLIPDEDMEKIAAFAGNHKLGFASLPAGKNWHLAAFAENMELAGQVLFYSHIKNHAQLGSVLGYPSCCVANYLCHASRLASEETYALLDKQNNQDKQTLSRHPFLMNYLLRAHDISILSHVPCSFSCQESKKQAQQIFTAIEKRNPQLAAYLADNLRGPVIVHEEAAHPLRGYTLVGNHVYYAHSPVTRESYMHDVFRQCNHVEVIQQDHVKLCKDDHVVDELKGNHVRFLLFE